MNQDDPPRGGPVNIRVVDARGERSEEATVPSDAAAARLIAKLVELMNLPTAGPDGVPLRYRFHHQRTGRQLDDDDTLASAGVRGGDTLRLVAELSAGGPGWIEVADPDVVPYHSVQIRRTLARPRRHVDLARELANDISRIKF